MIAKATYFNALICILLVSCNTTKSSAQKVDSDRKQKIKVFFLAGQSNMDGRARAFNLTKNDKERLEKAKQNVKLYYNHQKLVPLQITTPAKHTQNKFGAETMFGPELFFGIHLSEKYPEHKIILIKRSRGGMSLYGAWNPNWDEDKAKAMNENNAPKLYNDFIAYAKEVLSGFDELEYELSGMLWVQGETDSGKKRHGAIPADTYKENLRTLIKGVRTEFDKPELPFLIFQVGHGKVVKAMKSIAENDEFVSLIPQEKDKMSKYYFERNPMPIGHYTYKSMKKIGQYFFEYYQSNYANNIEN